MSKKSTALLWLLKLPFRPYLRWFTGVVVIVFIAAYLTGYLGHATRFAWYRWWPFGTALIEYAPADARAFVLVDLTQKGSSKLQTLAQSPALRERIGALAEALDINPQRDVLQLMLALESPTDGDVIVARGRFSPSSIRDSLENRGYKASTLESGLLLTHQSTQEAILLPNSSVLLYGQSGSLSRAIERSQGRSSTLADNDVFMDWLDHIGTHRAVTVLRVAPQQNAALSELAAGTPQRLSAMGLIVDTSRENDVFLDLVLGPKNQAEVDELRQQSSKSVDTLRASLPLLPLPHLKALISTLQVNSDDRAVFIQASSSPEELARLFQQPATGGQLLVSLSALAMAFAAGSVIPAWVVDSPQRPQSPTPTVTEALQDGLRGLMQPSSRSATAPGQ